MRRARDAAIAEGEALRSELAAAVAMRDLALAEREAALAQRDPAQDRQGGYSTSEYGIPLASRPRARGPATPAGISSQPQRDSRTVHQVGRICRNAPLGTPFRRARPSSLNLPR